MSSSNDMLSKSCNCFWDQLFKITKCIDNLYKYRLKCMMLVCCFLLRCLFLYESKVGVMREDLVRENDGDGRCGEKGVEREGVMRGGVEREVVGDCWGWRV